MAIRRDTGGRFLGAVDIDAGALLGLDGLEERARLMPQELNDALTVYGISLGNYAEGKFSHGYSATASKGRNYLQNRSGAGRRSFGFNVTGGGAAVDLEFFTTQAYIASQEFGATIKPKTATYLTIPLEGNLNPSGEPYETASESIELGAFFYESQNGNLFIVQEEAGELEFLFYLTRGPVEIPKRLGVGDYIERGAVQKKLLADIVKAVVNVTAEIFP